MIYAVVNFTVTDSEMLTAYAAKAGPALAKWGGKPAAMSTEPTRLEGDSALPGRVVLLSFPDRNSALGWINDPELAEVHGLRRAAGKSDIVLIA